MQDPGAGGPHQGILVDIGPLNLLGSVPGQDHGSAQHVQVLLQRHSTEEEHEEELDASLLCLLTPLFPRTPQGLLVGCLVAGPSCRLSQGKGLGSYGTQGSQLQLGTERACWDANKPLLTIGCVRVGQGLPCPP